MTWEVDPLPGAYPQWFRDAGHAVIENSGNLLLLGVTAQRMKAIDLWRHIRCECLGEGPQGMRSGAVPDPDKRVSGRAHCGCAEWGSVVGQPESSLRALLFLPSK